MADNLAPFPIDPTLTAISIAYRNDAQTLIADRVLPKTKVGTKSFEYLNFDSAQSFTVPDTKIGRKSQPNIVEFYGEEKSGSVVDYGLDDIIPFDDINQAKASGWGFDPKAKAVEYLTDLMMLDREKRVAKMVQDSTNYLTTQTENLSGASQWSHADSNPMSAILAALDKPLMRPNTMVIGREAWTKLRQHPKLVSAAQRNSGNQGSIARAELAELLEIKQILIGDSFVNSARKGQAATLSRTWGKNAAFLHINPGSTISHGASWGFTASYLGWRVGTKFNDMLGVRGALVVRAVDSLSEIVTAKNLGYLF